jgi:hypothetical protein
MRTIEVGGGPASRWVSLRSTYPTPERDFQQLHIWIYKSKLRQKMHKKYSFIPSYADELTIHFNAVPSALPPLYVGEDEAGNLFKISLSFDPESRTYQD